MIGTVLILAFVVFYALFCLALAHILTALQAPGYVQAIYYVVCGLGWIFPLMPLIKWMEKKPNP